MGWGGKWERGSGWGTHVNPWLIHVNVWQKPQQQQQKILLPMQEPQKIPGDRKIPWRRTWQPILVWRIPWTEEPGWLQSAGSQRVRHNSATEHACKVTCVEKTKHLFFWSLFLSVKKKPSCLLVCRRPLAETRPANYPFFSFLPWTLCFPSENGPVGPQKQETESFSCFSCV